MLPEPEKNNCLYCGELIIGRTDKRFCNLHCKSAYHNRKPNSDEALIRKMNKQLRQNRSALKKACPMGKATVRKSFLQTLGMHFKYYTHTWSNQWGQVYHFCYDYGYAQIDDPEKVLIVQHQAYMD
jgi:hypothetical protein